MTGQEVQRWADAAQYHSDALPPENRASGGGARPTVRLLNATPDPLGSLAALCGIYEGRVVRGLAEVTDDQRRAAWQAMQETVLDGPLESIQFHFLIEGVTRAFTHQAVRNRFSFFAQESMRFAVVDSEPWLDRQAYPPSLAAAPVNVAEVRERVAEYRVGEDFERPDFMTPEEYNYALRRDAWDDAIISVENAYKQLVAAGVPAEEARGLMPHSMTTRYHWIVSARTLLAEAGKRLCTQAQFEWRVVMAEIVKALREYPQETSECSDRWCRDGAEHAHYRVDPSQRWQFDAMADLLRPVCYQEGHCGFMAKFDRGCNIRERVNRFAANNIPSSQWDTAGRYDVAAGTLGEQTLFVDDRPVSSFAEFRPLLPVRPKEWLADPAAARTRPGGANAE